MTGAYYIGLMSGTSMDGIDAALVELSNGEARLLASHCRKYPPEVVEQLERALKLLEPRTADLDELDRLVGENFAGAAIELLAKAGIAADRITAIGSHGQTIRHAPDADTPYSLQIGSGAIISALTGIETVTDFRSADINAGGQGAPLVPAFHAAVLRSDTENRVIVNIGGIANITVLPASTSAAVTGFDTGPGNTLMDAWIRRHQGEQFDHDGAWASSGKHDARLLAAMLRDAYFRLPPPKSTGREHFNLSWLSAFVQDISIPTNDIQATLCELTAITIADAVEMHAPDTRRILVCGGGAHNIHLMRRLNENLPDIPVETTQSIGVDPDWVEACAFAWLAKQHLEGKPGNIPTVTGAGEPVVLGRLFKADAAQKR
ncbi:MAG: anhydro-N-acetylmuramic acid kinase [Gammaproteobacteria bacterium]|nr:anhydro-N-acetylmuramic acid kinase [Gammaproteobacteria bacterium]